MPTVLITSRSFGKRNRQPLELLESKDYRLRFNDLGRPLEAEELIERLADCDGCIAGLDHFTADVIEASPQLRIISRYGAGVDRVDLAAAAKAGVVVTNTPEANSDAVADLAVALMLAVARKIPTADRLVREGRWQNIYGVALSNTTVGILGFGRIGRRVAARVRGFGCRVVAHDPFLEADAIRQAGAEPMSFDELLEEADFLSLHLPVTEDTQGLIGIEQFDRMKESAILVNTARGELIDQAALLAALRDGEILGAGLDAHAEEPLDARPFDGMDNVVLTPHMGGYTDEALNNMGMAAAENLCAFFEGQETHSLAAGRAK